METKLYNYLDFRDFIRDEVYSRKRVGEKVTFETIAKKAKLHKSYFSKVLSGNASLSHDQAFNISLALGLGKEETNFFLKLIDFDTTSIKVRRDDIKEQLLRIKTSKQQTEEHIDATPFRYENKELREKYYNEPLHQIIHMALTIENSENRIKKVLASLNYPSEKIYKVINNLVQMGLVKRVKDDAITIEDNIHLPKDSELYFSWKRNLNALTENRMQHFARKDDLSFSTVFTCDQKTKDEIHEDFLLFLKRSQEKVKKSPASNVYQMNFDLFDWL